MTLKSEPLNFYGRTNIALRLATVHPILVSVIVTTGLSVLFLVFPGIDIAISGLFFHPGTGFWAASNSLLKVLRSFGLLSINISIVIVVSLTLARCMVPLRRMPTFLSRIQPRTVVFLTTTLAVGPGLIANIILKDHWGRARPLQTTLFGGEHAFSLPWVISDGCARNCSFVSGEGSGVFWLVALVFVVPATIRTRIAIATLAWATLISLNRIAFGGHFLSDVLIGWGLMLIVILVARDTILIRFGGRIDASIARWVGRGSRATP